jgi:hypothetical protein
MDNLNYDVPGIIIDNYDWVENLSVEFAMESQRRFWTMARFAMGSTGRANGSFRYRSQQK